MSVVTEPYEVRAVTQTQAQHHRNDDLHPATRESTSSGAVAAVSAHKWDYLTDEEIQQIIDALALHDEPQLNQARLILTAALQARHGDDNASQSLVGLCGKSDPEQAIDFAMTLFKITVFNPSLRQKGPRATKVMGEISAWQTEIPFPTFGAHVFPNAKNIYVVREGGGRQSDSLHLLVDGVRWKMRSVYKNGGRVLEELSEDLLDTSWEDLLDYLTAVTQSPVTPLFAHDLAASVGIPTVEAKYFYLDNIPGEWLHPPSGKDESKDLREAHPDMDDAGLLNYLNQRYHGVFALEPHMHKSNKKLDDLTEHVPGKIKSIKGYEDVLLELMESGKKRIDAEAHARVRLFCLWMGDWDKHRDQFKWAKVDNGDADVFYSMPRDFDQVASTNRDGATSTQRPLLARAVDLIGGERNVIVKSMTSPFEKVLTQPEAYLTTGEFSIDRLVFQSMQREDFVRIAEELASALTDEVIEHAIMANWLPELGSHRMNELIDIFKARRESLVDAANFFYEALARNLTIVGSHANEKFDVVREEDEDGAKAGWRITVTVIDEGEHHVSQSRLVNAEDTESVLVYGLGGSDHFVLPDDYDGPPIHISPSVPEAWRDKLEVEGEENDQVIGGNRRTIIHANSRAGVVGDARLDKNTDMSHEAWRWDERNRNTYRLPYRTTTLGVQNTPGGLQGSAKLQWTNPDQIHVNHRFGTRSTLSLSGGGGEMRSLSAAYTREWAGADKPGYLSTTTMRAEGNLGQSSRFHGFGNQTPHTDDNTLYMNSIKASLARQWNFSGDEFTSSLEVGGRFSFQDVYREISTQLAQDWDPMTHGAVFINASTQSVPQKHEENAETHEQGEQKADPNSWGADFNLEAAGGSFTYVTVGGRVYGTKHIGTLALFGEAGGSLSLHGPGNHQLGSNAFEPVQQGRYTGDQSRFWGMAGAQKKFADFRIGEAPVGLTGWGKYHVGGVTSTGTEFGGVHHGASAGLGLQAPGSAPKFEVQIGWAKELTKGFEDNPGQLVIGLKTNF